MTPAGIAPLALGVDFVMHSTTKFLGGKIQRMILQRLSYLNAVCQGWHQS